MPRPYVPVTKAIAQADWLEMAARLNSAFAAERSRIPTRDRELLDRIANEKQKSDGTETRHPTHFRFVAKVEDRMFLGDEELTYASLLDRARFQHFEIAYLSIEDLNVEISDFCYLLEIFDSQLACGAREPKESRKGQTTEVHADKRMSEWIVEHLCRMYRRVFGQHPYLGGVGVSAEERTPNSPFGIFAKFVLDALDVKTRNGSAYSIKTIKDCMPAGGLKAFRLPDEPQLIAARQAWKRRRGRPSVSSPANEAKRPSKAKKLAPANRTPDTI